MKYITTINSENTAVVVQLDGHIIQLPSLIQINSQLDLYFEFDYRQTAYGNNILISPVHYKILNDQVQILSVDHEVGDQGPHPQHLTIYVR